MKNDVKVGLVIGLVFVTALIVFLWNQREDETATLAVENDLGEFDNAISEMRNAVTERSTVGTTTPPDRTVEAVEPAGTATTDGEGSIDAGSLIGPDQLDRSSETGTAADAGTGTTKATETAAKPKASRYVVKKGDTLWSIAQSFYGDGRKSNLILAANKSRLPNKDMLTPNMELVIPAAPEKPALLSIERNAPEADAGSKYTVRKGDTLWAISKRVYGDGKHWPRIARANHIVEGKQLHEGMSLIIPEKPE